jgi:UDP-N-acetylmuramoyl-L-alanyl-D-glutamate--2,6-diaminopimelate ligase
MIAPVLLSQVSQVLRDAGLTARPEDFTDLEISGVSQDSRTVRQGDLFLAWKGMESDAHDFMHQAESAGAAAAVVERRVEGIAIPQLVVTDGRAAAAVVADFLLGSPWKSLFMVGITGTNGKTSTALLTRQLLAGRHRAAAIGTLGVVGPDGGIRPGTEGLTTPGPVQLSNWLRDLADDGVTAVSIEASSHALEQKRMGGLRFDVGVFTNLTQDHLDYHATMEEYRDAKASLATLLKPGGVIVSNADDPAWDNLADGGVRTIRYGRSERAHVRALDEQPGPEGTRFELRSGEDRAQLFLPLLGSFNVENATAAAAAAIQAGLTLSEVAERLSEAPQIPGRLERVSGEPVPVLIDFAHTPAALERVLETLRPLVAGRLIVVFGAGGDRDRTKRPRMGEAVERFADLAIVTSDNPRTEDPDAIIDDVMEGMAGDHVVRESDRKRAIRLALTEARPGDVILLAGKGHETYQVIGREKRPFDERQVVLEWLGTGGAA